jgi:hypothetical protein
MGERREVPKIESLKADKLILQLGMGETLEALQCVSLTHFDLGELTRELLWTVNSCICMVPAAVYYCSSSDGAWQQSAPPFANNVSSFKSSPAPVLHRYHVLIS